jgi:hypothetical protein
MTLNPSRDPLQSLDGMTKPLPTLLSELGSTADEIAAKLAEAGIEGDINEPCSCAIAAFIKANGYPDVAVGTNNDGGFYVETDDHSEFTIGQAGPIPDFIRAFDAGAYPHLVRQGAW